MPSTASLVQLAEILLNDTGVTMGSKDPATVAEEIWNALAAPTERPAWLPAWATEAFFKDPANAPFAAAIAPAINNAQGGLDMNAFAAALAARLRTDPASSAPRAPTAYDLPAFSGAMDKYREWRDAFLSAVAAAGSTTAADFQSAIGAAMVKFTDTASSWAQGITPTDFTTAAAFIDRMDTTFITAEYVDEARRSLSAWRCPTAASWTTFIAEFEFRCREAGRFDVSDAAITPGSALAEAFIVKVTKETRQELVRRFGVLSTQSYQDLKDFAAPRWVPSAVPADRTTDVPARRSAPTFAGPPTGPPAPPATPPPATPPPATPPPATPPASNRTASNRTGNNDARRRRRGVACSYDEPGTVVPREFRGSLYNKADADAAQNQAARERNARVREADRCERCRRPRADHKGDQVFRPVSAFRGPKAAGRNV